MKNNNKIIKVTYVTFGSTSPSANLKQQEHKCMVLKLDASSEHGAHLWGKLDISIW